MIHIIVILHFMAIWAGVMTLLMSYIKLRRHKDLTIKWLFLVDLTFTLNMVLDALRIYMAKNVASVPQMFWLVLEPLMYLTSVATVITSAKLVSTTNQGSKAKKGLWILIVISSVPFVTSIAENISHNLFNQYVIPVCFVLMLVWCIIYGVSSLFTASSHYKPIVITFLVTITVYLIVYLVTGVIPGLPLWVHMVPYFQLIYLVLNVLGLIFLINIKNVSSVQTLEDTYKQTSFDYMKVLGAEFGLTARELEIISEVFEGKNNNEIGDKLFISPNTVKNHVYNIYKKMGIKNRYELMALISQKREISLNTESLNI